MTHRMPCSGDFKAMRPIPLTTHKFYRPCFTAPVPAPVPLLPCARALSRNAAARTSSTALRWSSIGWMVLAATSNRISISLPDGRKSAKIDAGLGIIWGIPDNECRARHGHHSLDLPLSGERLKPRGASSHRACAPAKPCLATGSMPSRTDRPGSILRRRPICRSSIF